MVNCRYYGRCQHRRHVFGSCGSCANNDAGHVSRVWVRPKPKRKWRSY